MKSFIAIAALAAASVFAASAPARADGTVYRQVVRIDHGDLATEKGVNHVYRRLGQAANVVCGDYQSSDLLHTQAFQQCVQEAVSRAVNQIHDVRLTRYHESQINPSATPILSADVPVARS